jgi:hypothetical protein
VPGLDQSHPPAGAGEQQSGGQTGESTSYHQILEGVVVGERIVHDGQFPVKPQRGHAQLSQCVVVESWSGCLVGVLES